MSDANSPTRPRELFILQEPGTNRALIAEAGETRKWEGVRFVERAAYDNAVNKSYALVKILENERDEAQAEIEAWKKKYIDARKSGYAEGKEEQSAEIEQLKGGMNFNYQKNRELCDHLSEYGALLTELADALEWYFSHWGTSSQEFKTQGYAIAKDALEKYEKFKRGESK